MKLNYITTNRTEEHVIQKFGDARLVRLADGRHELIGGSTADVAEAKEWISLFAHEIVFSQPGCPPASSHRLRNRRFLSRFRLASRRWS